MKAPRQVRAKVTLELQLRIPTRCNFTGSEDGKGHDTLWLDVEPRDARAVITAFRQALRELEAEAGPGGRLHPRRRR